MIPSSKRLNAIVEWVEGNVLADIGCDHAYVAVEAVLSGKVQKAYACDIAEGPLNNAKKTIEIHNVKDKVTCILMNGMENLPDDADIVVIAGMGSKTIEQILENGKIENRSFLLVPHKDPDSLRAYCKNHRLFIKQERMIFDEGHYYPLMKVFYDGNTIQQINETELLYGVNMIKDQVYDEFLEKEFSKWKLINEQMPENKKEVSQSKLMILSNLIKN